MLQLAVISGNKPTPEVCQPGKATQRLKDEPVRSACQSLRTIHEHDEPSPSQPPRQRFSSTNSVYLPRRDASEGAGIQRRQINLVGLNRHPDHTLVSGIGVCKLGVLRHAQIMTSDAAHVWLDAPVFSAIAVTLRA